MKDIQDHNAQNCWRPVPSVVPTAIPAMSDDECLVRLAHFVERPDAAGLEEVARLIGRLAVTIE